MSLEQLSYLAQILGSVGVIVFLLFTSARRSSRTRVHFEAQRAQFHHLSGRLEWTVIRTRPLPQTAIWPS